jgi:hypothetical protein
VGSTPLDVSSLSADVAVTKVDSADPVPVLGQFDYVIEVTNQGPSLAEWVQIYDDLPASLELTGLSMSNIHLGCTTQGHLPGGTFDHCTVGDMSPGDRATLVLQVKVKPGTAPGTVLTNAAYITSHTSDPDAANDQGLGGHDY